jgi:hypothetical protein
MTSPSRALLAASLLFFVPVAGAQVRVSPKKIKIEQPKPKLAKFNGEVLYMTRIAITVRSRENTNLVRTFSYDEKLAPKMAKMTDDDKTYQFGDVVEIEYADGTDQARDIKGKPGQKR